MRRVLAPFAFLALLPLLGVTSCASVFSDYCDKEVGCAGGNDKDKSACADQLRGQEKAAADYGCGDQFDAVYTCRNNGTCDPTKKQFQTACDVQKQAYDNCVAANSAIR